MEGGRKDVRGELEAVDNLKFGGHRGPTQKVSHEHLD